MIAGYRFYSGTSATTTWDGSTATSATNGDFHFYYWETKYSRPIAQATNVSAEIKRALQLLRSRAWAEAPARVVVTAQPPKKHLGDEALRWGWPPTLRAPPLVLS